VLRWLLRFGASAGIVFVVYPAVRQGWTHVETDFPNYYTAAVLARHHAPLRKFYDWTWFQRQMNYAGWERQLGGYIPHSPLTMLPILPLSGLAPMTAKRAWLAANLILLIAAIVLLARLGKLPCSGLLLLATAGYTALSRNFVFGQYYIFILILLAASFWLLLRGQEFGAGILLGLVFVLKLYAGPFLLYFAWKRQWRAVAGMITAGSALALLSVGIYGWSDNLYYLTSVLPRALGGESTDPYAPGLTTVSNMLRHAFVLEPELNPHPIANIPAAAFFIQSLITLAAPLFCLISMPRSRNTDQRRELAWFLVMLLFVSPSRVQYMGVMLLVTVALLWNTSGTRARIALIAVYLSLTIQPPTSWMPWFLSVWILLGWYLALGAQYLRKLRPLVATGVAATLVLAAGWSAYRRMQSFRIEPPDTMDRAMVRRGAIYSGAPAVSSAGIVFASIGPGRYELVHADGASETYSFAGHAFHPSVPAAGGPIYLELVSGGHSRLMRYDALTKSLTTAVAQPFEPTDPSVSADGQKLAFVDHDRIVVYHHGAAERVSTSGPVHDVNWFPDGEKLVFSMGLLGSSQIFAASPEAAAIQLTRDSGDHTEPAISPDGNWLAYTVERDGTKQIWVRSLRSGSQSPVTQGSCNSYSPAWTIDSRSLIFASDCERGQGLGALYRWLLN